MTTLHEAVKKLAECTHPMPIRVGAIHRCPHCGSMRLAGGVRWARPHLVEQVFISWKDPFPSGEEGTG